MVVMEIVVSITWKYERRKHTIRHHRPLHRLLLLLLLPAPRSAVCSGVHAARGSDEGGSMSVSAVRRPRALVRRTHPLAG